MREALALSFAAAIACLGCSSGEEPRGPTEDAVADARLLLGTMLEDPARLPLEEVDEAIRDDRPVLAADLIGQGARPATERQIERVRGLEMSSAEGRRMRSRAVRLYRDRREALDAMRAALSRGIGMEDEQLVEAMHLDAQAQMALVALEDELGRLAPDLDDRPPLEQRGAPPPVPRPEEAMLDDPSPPERPESPNPGASEPIAIPEPE